MINSTDLNNITITGINPGTTNIILYTNYDNDDKDEFFRAFPITVKAERKIDHVEWKVLDQKLNAGIPTAKATIVATIYDQYNEFYSVADLSKLSVTWNNKSAVKVNVADGTLTTGWNDTLKLNVSKSFDITYANDADKPAKVDQPQSAMLVLDGNGVKVNKTISVSKETTVANVKFDCSAAALDTGLTKTGSGATAKTAELQLKTTGKNGFDIGTMDFVRVSADPQKAVSYAALGLDLEDAKAGIYLVRAQYKAANADAEELATGANVAIADNKITLTNIVSGNKLAKGDYNFTFYKYQCNDDGKTKLATVIARQTVTVTDTDKPVTVEILSDTVGSISDMFKVKFDGDESVVIDVDCPTGYYEQSASALYVKKLKVKANTEIFGEQTFDVNVNKLFKIST